MAREKRRQRTGTKGRGESEGGPIEVPDETLGNDDDLDADDDTPVIDLDDAELDAGGDDLQRLIAETVAIAPEEQAGSEPDEPAIDLDVDSEPEPRTEVLVDDARGLETAPLAASPVGDGLPSPEEPAERNRAARPSGDHVAGADPSRVEPVDAGAGARDPPAAAARRATDLGPVSSPAVRDRLLAQALAHAEHKDARYRVPSAAPTSAARWKLVAAGVILLVAAVAAVAPPRWARPEPAAVLGPADHAHSLRVALILQAQQIEAFRVRTQRLPVALDETRAILPGIRYVRSGNRTYQLIAYEADGNAVVYDSASPIDGPGTLGAGWAAPELQP